MDDITAYLRSQGLRVAKIHGGIQPRERKRTMREIQNMEYQYVVATDLAARGIDIEGVSLVINDDIPKDLEFFVHRVGRTGRNGMSGTAVTLYAPSEDKLVAELEKMGITFSEKRFSNGELVDFYDRNRRLKRKTKNKSLDPKLIGMVKKEKQKRKPGYKNKIKRAIQKDERQKRKLKRREEMRANRKK